MSLLYRAYAKQNEHGYWVGMLEYPDGTHAVLTNAKYTESDALDIAGRLADNLNKRTNVLSGEERAEQMTTSFDDVVRHGLTYDQTGTGHDRVTCLCGKTIVRQPWMSDDVWRSRVRVLSHDNHDEPNASPTGKPDKALREAEDRALSLQNAVLNGQCDPEAASQEIIGLAVQTDIIADHAGIK